MGQGNESNMLKYYNMGDHVSILTPWLTFMYLDIIKVKKHSTRFLFIAVSFYEILLDHRVCKYLQTFVVLKKSCTNLITLIVFLPLAYVLPFFFFAYLSVIFIFCLLDFCLFNIKLQKTSQQCHAKPYLRLRQKKISNTDVYLKFSYFINHAFLLLLF